VKVIEKLFKASMITAVLANLYLSVTH